jgi:hypothetical protein
MNEIEKMYKNAGIEPIAEYCKHQCNNEFDDDACIGCKYIEKVEYPPFTAEKVICLLEWEANRGIIDIKHSQNGYQLFTYIHTGNYGKSIIDAVASYFCVKWQDLTEEEKRHIKEILERVNTYLTDFEESLNDRKLTFIT